MNAGTDLHACWTLNYVAVAVTTTAARVFWPLYPIEDCDSGIHCTTAQNGTLGECIITIARWFACQWLFQALFWGRDSSQDFFFNQMIFCQGVLNSGCIGFQKSQKNKNKQKKKLFWLALIAMDSWGNHNYHLFVAFYQALQNITICSGRKICYCFKLCISLYTMIPFQQFLRHCMHVLALQI